MSLPTVQFPENESLKVAVLGCGFWSNFQIAAWHEQPGVHVIAVCDPDVAKAAAVASRWNVKEIFTSPEALLAKVRPDVVDIISPAETHPQLIKLIADHGLPIICQKPMALSLVEAESAVAHCAEKKVPFFIHENWRWQTPLRTLHATLASNAIGEVYRARLDFANGFPVFVNQPFLASLDKFILADIGAHVLDTVRFLFGEPQSVYCRTQKIHPNIRGEDVATVMLGIGNATVTCNLSYAENFYEHDRFPETFAFIEGSAGTIELGSDYSLRVTTSRGTHITRAAPPRYAWADPRYEVVQASMVPCLANLTAALRGEAPAETTGEDNLQTLRLVFAAYDSAATGNVIPIPAPHSPLLRRHP